MTLFINNEEISEKFLEQAFQHMKKAYLTEGGCGCGDDCNCEGDDRGCEGHAHEMPSDEMIREQAKESLIENILLKQHVMANIPESTSEEIEAFIAIHGDKYTSIADISIRFDKFSVQLEESIVAPSKEEVQEYYENNKDQMIDEDDELIPFEELEEELTEELFNDIKAANFDLFFQTLLDNATIEEK